jgi:hypothetical protein
MPTRAPCALALAALALLLAGCVPLLPAKKDANQLPPVRLPPDAVAVDIATLRLPPGDSDLYDEIWQAADEQSIPVETRRELAANGLRAGIYGQEPPTCLRALLHAPQAKISDISDAAAELELGSTRQHLPLRAGHRSVIQASPVFPSLPILTSDAGSVRGHQLTDARCTFALKAYPLGDGRAKLTLTPEIEHGESKSRWIGGEGLMIQQTGQDRLVLERLALDAVLSPGQWLILSTTPDIKGLGQHYFAHSAGGTLHRRVLVLRYSQTQFDDLFAPEQTTARLATPAE